ncbi:hypothetical protein FPZ42_07770 [Mucilaginibacter achroorhodeus]|uniref:Uncharacterized protein n=1 Tax=Mucilaginibacter achroorhodeus TaxID=2599294 RepID=A0A563U6I0_9SPHI|nr:hypothetical protein FPZ42_07770 [Mucilaginibacter achroorhodeus]
MENKICHYRNCNKELINKRPHAKYCSRACKSNEAKYVRRKKLFIKKYAAKQMDLIDAIKHLKSLLV